MSQKNSQTNTDSAPDVQVRFLLGLNDQVIESTQAKCSKCKTATPHQWLKIPVQAIVPTDPLELLGMARRLTLCQNCGNMSLTK